MGSWRSVGGAGIGELQLHRVAVDLAGDVEEVAGIEPDLDPVLIVVDLELFRGAARIRIDHGKRQLAVAGREFHGPAALRRDGRDAVDGGGELALVHFQELVVALRDDPRVVREGAVDQLRGEHRLAEGEADLGGRQLHFHRHVRRLGEALHLGDRLARHDDAGHACRPDRGLHLAWARRWPSVATARRSVVPSRSTT